MGAQHAKLPPTAHPISLKGLQHTSVIGLLALWDYNQHFREWQSAFEIFSEFSHHNSGMSAEWPSSSDHEVPEVCLATEHTESQSLLPENSQNSMPKVQKIFSAHRLF